MKRHHMHPYTQAQRHHQEAEQEKAGGVGGAEEAKLPEDQVDVGAAKENESKEEDAKPEAQASDPQKILEEERLRMAAEMDNFKKRLNREHQEQTRFASEKVLSDLLPALDNLDLALRYASQNEACKDMTQGIEMTRKQLEEALAKHGLVSVGEEGEDFDPQIHEAIGMETRPDIKPGAVCKIMQKGYKLNDRLLRPAKVMVNNYQP